MGENYSSGLSDKLTGHWQQCKDCCARCGGYLTGGLWHDARRQHAVDKTCMMERDDCSWNRSALTHRQVTVPSASLTFPGHCGPAIHTHSHTDTHTSMQCAKFHRAVKAIRDQVVVNYTLREWKLQQGVTTTVTAVCLCPSFIQRMALFSLSRTNFLIINWAGLFLDCCCEVSVESWGITWSSVLSGWSVIFLRSWLFLSVSWSLQLFKVTVHTWWKLHI